LFGSLYAFGNEFIAGEGEELSDCENVPQFGSGFDIRSPATFALR
jgi:hypothetical protein